MRMAEAKLCIPNRYAFGAFVSFSQASATDLYLIVAGANVVRLRRITLAAGQSSPGRIGVNLIKRASDNRRHAQHDRTRGVRQHHARGNSCCVLVLGEPVSAWDQSGRGGGGSRNRLVQRRRGFTRPRCTVVRRAAGLASWRGVGRQSKCRDAARRFFPRSQHEMGRGLISRPL